MIEANVFFQFFQFNLLPTWNFFLLKESWRQSLETPQTLSTIVPHIAQSKMWLYPCQTISTTVSGMPQRRVLRSRVELEHKFWAYSLIGSSFDMFFLPNMSLFSMFGPRQHSLASIFYCFHNRQIELSTSLRDMINDTPLAKESRKRWKEEEKSIQ